MGSNIGRVLSELPKWGKEGKGNEGTVKWRDTVGMSVEISYKNKLYTVNILDLVNGRLKIKYSDYDDYYITPSSFLGGKYGGLLRLKTSEYKYDVGDIVKHKNSDMTILKKIKIKHGIDKYEKGYEVRCEKCGSISEKTEIHLNSGHGCGVCINKVIDKDINSIHATDPWIEEYLVNKEDAYKYTFGSTCEKILFKCKNCGMTKKMTPYDFYKYGIGCKRCGDGASYPSKIVFNLLYQLNLNFETEKSDFDWLVDYGYRYDFYLIDYGLLIEVDGLQHKKEATGVFTPLEEQKRIDREKDELALKNGLKVIRIDCEKSELNFIKEKIIHTDLDKYFNLELVDWIECHKYAISSRVKEACDLWNSGIHSTPKIAELMKIKTSGCINKYLKQGLLLGWCDYNPKEVTAKIGSIYGRKNGIKCSKPLVCLETKQVFSSAKECSRQSEDVFGIVMHQGNISTSCRLGLKRYGYHFKYVQDLTEEEKIKYNIDLNKAI